MNDIPSGFVPDFPGDNPNRQWVRRLAEEKGIKIDQREVVMLLPKGSINILFHCMMRKEFPDYA